MRENSVQVDQTGGGEESHDQGPIVDLRREKGDAVWWMLGQEGWSE
jgi:hypothetical protein